MTAPGPAPAPPVDDLAISIQDPLSQNARKAVLNGHWSEGLSDADFAARDKLYSSYFNQYERGGKQCSINNIGQLNHRDIFDAFDIIKDSTKTRSSCAADLKGIIVASPDRFQLEGTAEDFVQLWIGHVVNYVLLVDGSEWRDDQTLQVFLIAHFEKSTQPDKAKLPRAFTARNLDLIAGIRIRWTNILSEHLTLDMDDTRVAIFDQERAIDMLKKGMIFPDGALDEVRQTLNLLLPGYDSASNRWLRRRRSKWYSPPWNPRPYRLSMPAADRTLNKSQRRMDNFHYFRDRLISLKEEYDNHEPQNIKQYYHDYRKPAQWWAFWIAVIVFLFGLIGIVEGAIQCYKAYYPS